MDDRQPDHTRSGIRLPLARSSLVPNLVAHRVLFWPGDDRLASETDKKADVVFVTEPEYSRVLAA